MSTGNKVLFQFFCDHCLYPYEITMKLTDLEKYDKGNEKIECPECKEPLRKLICPPRRIQIR